MDDQVVFAIDKAVRVGDRRWKLDGRAYQDVKVGEIVTIRRGHESDTPAFTVTGISAYGREIPEISRGLTGSLTVEGDDGDILTEVGALVRG